MAAEAGAEAAEGAGAEEEAEAGAEEEAGAEPTIRKGTSHALVAHVGF